MGQAAQHIGSSELTANYLSQTQHGMQQVKGPGPAGQQR
jgi:hypothetical protein